MLCDPAAGTQLYLLRTCRATFLAMFEVGMPPEMPGSHRSGCGISSVPQTSNQAWYVTDLVLSLPCYSL